MSKEQNNNIESNNSANEQSATTIMLAGDILRTKRVELGMTQKDIAERLRLRTTLIESIESNEFDSGQVDTFTKGYLKSYAKAVGIKAETVLHAFDYHQGSGRKETSMQSFSRKTKNEKHDSRLMRVTWVIFAIVIGITLLWWWQNEQKSALVVEQSVELSEQGYLSDTQQSNESLTGTESNIHPIASQPSDPEQTATSTELQPSQSEESSSTPVASEQGATEETSHTATTSEEQTQPENTNDRAQQTTVSAEPSLTMTFDADCWIQVKDATGKTLASGVKKKGDSLSMTGATPFKVVLGAPEAVKMTLSGEDVDLSGYTNAKVARLTLP